MSTPRTLYPAINLSKAIFSGSHLTQEQQQQLVHWVSTTINNLFYDVVVIEEGNMSKLPKKFQQILKDGKPLTLLQWTQFFTKVYEQGHSKIRQLPVDFLERVTDKQEWIEDAELHLLVASYCSFAIDFRPDPRKEYCRHLSGVMTAIGGYIDCGQACIIMWNNGLRGFDKTITETMLSNKPKMTCDEKSRLVADHLKKKDRYVNELSQILLEKVDSARAILMEDCQNIFEPQASHKEPVPSFEVSAKQMQVIMQQARAQLKEISTLFPVTERLLNKLHKNAEDAQEACKVQEAEVIKKNSTTKSDIAAKKKTNIMKDSTHIPSKKDYLRSNLENKAEAQSF